MSESRRFPRSLFQPGIAAIYACTGASPSAFAICGLPPERRTTFLPFRALTGLASLAPGVAFAPAFAGPLLLVVGFRYDKLARSFLDALHVVPADINLTAPIPAPGLQRTAATRPGRPGRPAADLAGSTPAPCPGDRKRVV